MSLSAEFARLRALFERAHMKTLYSLLLITTLLTSSCIAQADQMVSDCTIDTVNPRVSEDGSNLFVIAARENPASKSITVGLIPVEVGDNYGGYGSWDEMVGALTVSVLSSGNVETPVNIESCPNQVAVTVLAGGPTWGKIDGIKVKVKGRSNAGIDAHPYQELGDDAVAVRFQKSAFLKQMGCLLIRSQYKEPFCKYWDE